MPQQSPGKGKSAMSDEKVVHMDIVESYTPPFEYPNMPPDVFKIVQQFHVNPSIWWVGLTASYLMRMNPEMENRIKSDQIEWNWPKNEPIIG
jgi:hypothetical protein